jgi:hypothetical protein
MPASDCLPAAWKAEVAREVAAEAPAQMVHATEATERGVDVNGPREQRSTNVAFWHECEVATSNVNVCEEPGTGPKTNRAPSSHSCQ